jgi:hypothetical protein
VKRLYEEILLKEKAKAELLEEEKFLSKDEIDKIVN